MVERLAVILETDLKTVEQTGYVKVRVRDQAGLHHHTTFESRTSANEYEDDSCTSYFRRTGELEYYHVLIMLRSYYCDLFV